jgi:hypothetical protein
VPKKKRIAVQTTSGKRFVYSTETEKPYSDKFAEWLDSLQFDYFCTFTTPYELTIPSARRAMEGLFDNLKKDFSPVDTSQLVPDARNDLKMFFATEPFDVKEGHHTHALIRYRKFLPHVHERNFSSPSAYREYCSTPTSELDHRLTIFNSWQYVSGSKGRLVQQGATMCQQEQNKIEVTGKFHRADVKRIDPKRRASSYCSKYILKTRSDYDLLYI